MLPPGTRLHRLLLALVVIGNTVLFAGLDPPTRAVTAVLVLVLVLDLRRLPEVLPAHRLAGIGLAGLVVLHVVPLPAALRALLQPGLAGLSHPGWAPLSVAPWGTLESAAGLAVMVGIALTAARMAGTRTGLPALLGLLGAAALLLAVLGLASEAGGREKVMLVRANTGAGGTYGPFVNHNHFAQALELSLPAVLVLLAVGARHLSRHGEERRQGVVVTLGAIVVLAVGIAAMLRCGSRGGVLFLALAGLLCVPLWLRPRRAIPWRWLLAAGAVGAFAVAFAWTRLPALSDGFKQLLVVEGVEGNSRVDLWAGTWRLAMRAPLVGVGLGAYREAIGLDKPATGGGVLEQAHNDWLEWLATTGVVGVVVLLVAVAGVLAALRPSRVRWLRFEYRYALAGAAVALLATACHEAVEFGLHVPLNRYLLACWLGLLWGVVTTTTRGRSGRADTGGEAANGGLPAVSSQPSGSAAKPHESGEAVGGADS